MLASRVAHASAKGWSQQARHPSQHGRMRSSPRRLFEPVPAQGGRDPVATCLSGKDRNVMIREQTLRIYSEEAGGCVGVVAKPLSLGIKGLQDEEYHPQIFLPGGGGFAIISIS